VGLVYFGVAAKGEKTHIKERRFGDIGRREVRLESVREAIALARSAVKPGLRHA
jgi:nicotinamide-nucleotide amidase